MKKFIFLLSLISVCVVSAQEKTNRSRDITISGAVVQPGVVRLTDDGWGLVEAVAKAGGLKAEADGRHVTVRFKVGGEKVFDLQAIYRKTEKNPQLSDGDLVIVRKYGEESSQAPEPTTLLVTPSFAAEERSHDVRLQRIG